MVYTTSSLNQITVSKLHWWSVVYTRWLPRAEQSDTPPGGRSHRDAPPRTASRRSTAPVNQSDTPPGGRGHCDALPRTASRRSTAPVNQSDTPPGGRSHRDAPPRTGPLLLSIERRLFPPAVISTGIQNEIPVRVPYKNTGTSVYRKPVRSTTIW